MREHLPPGWKRDNRTRSWSHESGAQISDQLMRQVVDRGRYDLLKRAIKEHNMSYFNANLTANTTASNMTNYPDYQSMQQWAAQAPRWHSFTCGHQIKLEPNQPAPLRCTICPMPKALHHEYKPCGHLHNYYEGDQLPTACPVCAMAEYQQREAQKKAAQEEQQRRARLAEEAKNPLAWLDRELEKMAAPL